MFACRTCSAEIIACAARSLSLSLCVWCHHTETVKHISCIARSLSPALVLLLPCMRSKRLLYTPIKLNFKVCRDSFIASVKRRCRWAVSDCEKCTSAVLYNQKYQSVLTTCGTV